MANPASALQRLTYNAGELSAMLGICKRTLSRLEQRGLIKSLCVLRTKLYTQVEVDRFLRESARLIS